MTDLAKLRKEEAELERRLAEIRQRRITQEEQERPELQKTRLPLRVILLSQLQEAETPMNSLLLAQLLEARLSKKIPSTRFGTLSKDEEASFKSRRARPVYLCHSLSHDTGLPIKRYWCRSDWPLSKRIFSPISSRVAFLKSAIWVVGLATHSADAANPDLLKFLAADLARDAGLLVKRGEFPFDEWLGFLRNSLEKFEKDDEVQRIEAAGTLEKKLNEAEQLFGAPPGLISLPGSSSSWRSAAR